MDRLLSPRLRAAALMPAALLTVHQLRFLLAFGGESGTELEKEGHQYLSALAAPIAMSVAIVVGLFFARLGVVGRGGGARASAASSSRGWRWCGGRAIPAPIRTPPRARDAAPSGTPAASPRPTPDA